MRTLAPNLGFLGSLITLPSSFLLLAFFRELAIWRWATCTRGRRRWGCSGVRAAANSQNRHSGVYRGDGTGIPKTREAVVRTATWRKRRACAAARVMSTSMPEKCRSQAFSIGGPLNSTPPDLLPPKHVHSTRLRDTATPLSRTATALYSPLQPRERSLHASRTFPGAPSSYGTLPTTAVATPPPLRALCTLPLPL